MNLAHHLAGLWADAAPGGGAGPIDLSNLPEGTGPVGAIILASIGLLTIAVPFVGRLIPDRKTGPTAPIDPAVTRADVDVLREHIARVERELAEARAETADVRHKYEAEADRNHDLEMQLAAAERRLERASEELTQLNAKLTLFMGGPLRPPMVVPPPPHPVRVPTRPTRPARPVGPDPDEAPTDPIAPNQRGARHP